MTVRRAKAGIAVAAVVAAIGIGAAATAPDPSRLDDAPGGAASAMVDPASATVTAAAEGEDEIWIDLPPDGSPLVRLRIDPPDRLLPGPPEHPEPAQYAPVDRPGPPLQVPRAELDASLRCPTPPSEATREVVLMIPGTTVTPEESFSWNYERALPAEGIPYCTVTLPNNTNGDIQIAAEYVVDTVRRIHADSGHRVILFGWSQGASTLPRWALRWWPDIRPMVASLVGLAPLNNVGSPVGNGPCLIGQCVPAAWQQRVGSAFMHALSSGQQTFPEIAYTVIYTRTDEVVTPDVDGRLSVLPEGPNVVNVAIQDVCPTDLSEHLLIPGSPAAYAVAMDAFRHPGEPADLSRVTAPQPCLPGTMPHVDVLDMLRWEASIVANLPLRLVTGMVDREPPLACYVSASCG